MQKIYFTVVGKIKESFYREAVAEYVKRLSRFAKVEIKEFFPNSCSTRASDKSVNPQDDNKAAFDEGFQGFVEEAKRLFRLSGDYCGGGRATSYKPGWFTKDEG